MKFTASLLASVALIVSGAQASLVCDDPNTDLTCCTFVDASGVGHGCYKYGADGDICGGVARCCSVGSRLLAYIENSFSACVEPEDIVIEIVEVETDRRVVDASAVDTDAVQDATA